MARKEYGFHNDVKGADTGLFGFAFDALKVIFKLTPDEDQTFFEFIMEKLGAAALFLISTAIILGIFLALFFEPIMDALT